METHKELFGRWAATAHRSEYSLKDWRSDQELHQCDVCRRWGTFGDEVRFIGDTEVECCEDCIVEVWGWAGKDSMALACEAPMGREVEFLTIQAASFGEHGKISSWGYEGKIAVTAATGSKE